MPMIRPTALRSLQSSLRYSGARATARAAPARTQLVARRYASSGHGGAHGEPSSDLPWILGALVITPPSCWYLWPDASHAEHHDSHAEHEEHAESEESEAPKEEEEAAPAEKEGGEEKPAESKESEKPADDKKESKDDEDKSDKKESKDDGDKAEKSESKEEPEKKENTGGKGKMADESAGQEQTRKLESSSKGGAKKRLDSGLAKDLGVGSASDDQENLPSSGHGAIGTKQKGWSNTDTRHSIQIDAPGSEKSTKGSGGPETAKHKGTVDPYAPAK